MTHDEIIVLAREAGWSGIYSSWTSPTNRTSLTVPVTMQQIEAFANLVAAKEREANIKIIKETPFSNWFQADVIEAIRARGEQA